MATHPLVHWTAHRVGGVGLGASHRGGGARGGRRGRGRGCWRRGGWRRGRDRGGWHCWAGRASSSGKQSLDLARHCRDRDLLPQCSRLAVVYRRRIGAPNQDGGQGHVRGRSHVRITVSQLVQVRVQPNASAYDENGAGLTGLPLVHPPPFFFSNHKNSTSASRGAPTPVFTSVRPTWPRTQRCVPR